MDAVKGLITALLCIILFIAVNVLGVAVWANATILNQDFVSRQMEKVDISEIADEVVDEFIADSVELPSEVAAFEDVIYDMMYEVIDEYEPWIQEQFDLVTEQIYDYLQGRSDVLNIEISLMELKSTLRDKLWTTLNENADTVLTRIVDNVVDYMIENPEEAVSYIPGDFLPAEAKYLTQDQLETYISENPELIREQVDSIGTADIVNELMGQLEATVQPFFDEYVDEIVTQIPDSYTIDEELLGEEGMEALNMAREYIGYFQTGFYVLIAVIIVLIGLVFLVYRRAREPGLAVGITLTVYGVFQTASSIVARSMDLFRYIEENGGITVPASLQSVVTSIYQDAIAPMLYFGIGVLVVGVALIVVGLVVKPRTAED